MFENIGEKLKGLASFMCWVGIILSVISGVSIIIDGTLFWGLFVAVLGSLGSWISSWVTYAIGEIAECTELIPSLYRNNKSNGNEKQPKQQKIVSIPKPITTKNYSTQKRCPHCGELVKSNICEMCGKENHLF